MLYSSGTWEREKKNKNYIYDESKGRLDSLKVYLHLHVPQWRKCCYRVFQNGVLVRNFENNKEEFIAGGKKSCV